MLHGRRRFLALTLGGVAGLGLASTGRAAGRRRAVIGGTVSLSGRFAAFGRPIQRSLRLWQEALNAAGGLGGHAIHLRLVDDGSDPERARSLFEEIVPASDLVVAPYGSWLTGAVLPIVERLGRPCIAPTAADPALWHGGNLAWTVQLLNPAGTMLHSVIDLATSTGVRTVGFVYRRGPFSEALVTGAARHARELSMGVRGLISYTQAQEARSAVARLAAPPQPALVVGMGFQPGGAGSGFLDDSLLLLDAVHSAGLAPKLLCLGIGAAGRAFLEAAGERAEGVLGSTGWRPYLPTPGNREFIQDYRSRWGSAPDAHAAQGYATGELFVRAWAVAERAGAGGPAPAAVRDSLFQLQTQTVFGRFRVADSGLQIAKENAVVQWQRERPIVVWPHRYQTGALRAAGIN